MQLQGNQLEGDLPPPWGAPGRWRALEALQLQGNALQGSLPAIWGAPGALPSLNALCAPCWSRFFFQNWVWGFAACLPPGACQLHAAQMQRKKGC